jgi:urate oxidase
MPRDFNSSHERCRAALVNAFYGPPKGGVYSPSVQYTLFQMAKGTMTAVPEVGSVFINMPNLHFIPCHPVDAKFEDDVYVATSEPHGNIEAVVTRAQIEPHCRL